LTTFFSSPISRGSRVCPPFWLPRGESPFVITFYADGDSFLSVHLCRFLCPPRGVILGSLSWSQNEPRYRAFLICFFPPLSLGKGFLYCLPPPLLTGLVVIVNDIPTWLILLKLTADVPRLKSKDFFLPAHRSDFF